jgi:hypothetical protein
MSGGLQQIHHPGKTGAARQFGRDLGQRDLLQRRHGDVSRPHGINAAHPDARAEPDADALRDLAADYGFAQPFGELHRSVPSKVSFDRAAG